jgi:hypothetical protein
MKTLMLATAAVLFSAPTLFAAPHSYQVTGPVLELTDKAIVVSKGKENWEITRDANTKIPADVKVGSKVTVEYTMTAVDVTDKTAKPSDKSAKKDKK